MKASSKCSIGSGRRDPCEKYIEQLVGASLTPPSHRLFGRSSSYRLSQIWSERWTPVCSLDLVGLRAETMYLLLPISSFQRDTDGRTIKLLPHACLACFYIVTWAYLLHFSGSYHTRLMRTSLSII